MVRVPTTFSLRFLEAFPDDEPEAEPLPYSDLSPREVDFLIIRCRRAMASYHRESQHPEAPRAEAAIVACQSIQQILLDLWKVAPEAKRSRIDAILRKY